MERNPTWPLRGPCCACPSSPKTQRGLKGQACGLLHPNCLVSKLRLMLVQQGKDLHLDSGHLLPCTTLDFVIICDYSISKKTTSSISLSTSSSHSSFMAQLLPPNCPFFSPVHSPLLSPSSSSLSCLDFSPISCLLYPTVCHPIMCFCQDPLSLILNQNIWQSPSPG